MDIQSIYKGQTIKTVTVSDITERNDDAVADFAIAAAGETRSSLFGWHVNYFPDADGVEDARAVVDLHTD